MIPTLVLWSLTLAALCASIFALLVAVRSSDRSLSRQLSALSTRSRELEATLDELSAQLKAQRQRENMRAYRLRKGSKTETADDLDEETTSTQSADEWRRRMNRQLALKGLK